MKVITIGRSSKNDVTINNSRVSQHHCQIVHHDNGTFSISDLGSTNGTTVNGHEINGKTALSRNDVVKLGGIIVPWLSYLEIKESINTPPPLKPQPKNDNTPTKQIKRQQPDGNKDHVIFISYSHLDKDFVELICSQLDKYGYSYWIDRTGIHHGEDFKERIVDAIMSSKIVLFISSKNSNKSSNTAKEIGVAESNNKAVIPIKIDNTPYNKSLQYDLCNKNWINFTGKANIDTFGKQLNESLCAYLSQKQAIQQ